MRHADVCLVLGPGGEALVSGTLEQFDDASAVVAVELSTDRDQRGEAAGPEPGIVVELVVTNEIRGAEHFAGIVVEADAHTVRIGELHLLGVTQQRDAVRVTTLIPATARPFVTPSGSSGSSGPSVLSGPAGTGAAPPADGPDRSAAAAAPVPARTPATIVDLSSTGLRFVAEHEFAVDTSVQLAFDAGRHFEVRAMVRRSEQTRVGYAHGCALLGLSRADSDDLHGYVLREQIAQRRRVEGR